MTSTHTHKQMDNVDKLPTHPERVRLLVAGLGGGLDVVNASAVYFMAKAAGYDATLGSIKSKSIDYIVGAQEIHPSAAWVLPTSKFKEMDAGLTGVRGRYCEAAIAAHLDEPILYFGQRVRGDRNVASLHDAFATIKDAYNFTHMIFVDCGGDSLTFRTSDAITYSEHTDPFLGGDAISLEALSGIRGAYLGVAGIGLDIKESAANKNLVEMISRNKYLGTFDLKADYFAGMHPAWDLPFTLSRRGQQEYFGLVEKIVKLSAADEHDSSKFSSLTAPVLYHAIRGKYGPQYTAARWAQGNEGVVTVNPGHSRIHMMQADEIHNIKKELNGK